MTGAALTLVLAGVLLAGCGGRPEDERDDAVAEMVAARDAALAELTGLAGRIGQVLDVEPGEPAEQWDTHWSTVSDDRSCSFSADVELRAGEAAPVPVYPVLLESRDEIGDDGQVQLGQDGSAVSGWEVDDVHVSWGVPLGSGAGTVRVSVISDDVDVPKSVADDDCELP